MDLRKCRIQLRREAELNRALNHSIRMKIMKMIAEEDSLSVTDIYTRYRFEGNPRQRMEQSVASQHLRILREAGFVNQERMGKNMFYSVNYKNLNKYLERIGVDIDELQENTPV